MFMETDKRIKQRQNLFEGQWGKLMESLVEGNLINMLNQRNIPVERVSTRVKGVRNGQEYEFDLDSQGQTNCTCGGKNYLEGKAHSTFYQQARKNQDILT